MYQLGDDLILDAETAHTTTYAAIGIRGSGKSYGMLDFGEEALKHGFWNNFIDPQGICHGLRTAADGKHDGFPVLLLGGIHDPDIKITADQGAKIAELLIMGSAKGVSSIIDLSEFRKNETRQFITAYLLEVFRLKNRNREPLMVYLDEAHLWAPQSADSGDAGILGAIEDVTGRGRQRGLFMFLTTQRAAKIHKSVLSQCETLFVMRQIAPQDRKAIADWLKDAVDPAEAKIALESLASLKQGEAWVFSPAYLGQFKRFKFRKRTTFDSSATPKAGEILPVVKKLARLPESVITEIQTTLNPPKPEPPAKLHQTRNNFPEKITERVEIRVPVPTLSPAEADRLEALGTRITMAIEELRKAFAEAAPLMAKAVKPPAIELPAVKKVLEADTSTTSSSRPATPVASSDAASRSAPAGLSKFGSKVLDALAQFASIGIETPEKDVISARCGVQRGGSTSRAIYAELRTAGLIDYPQAGLISLTDAGREVASWPDAPMTLNDLHDSFRTMLGNEPRVKLLDRIIAEYPAALDKHDLAIWLGCEAGGSTMRAHFAALRSLGAIDYPLVGKVAASKLLFPEGLQ